MLLRSCPYMEKLPELVRDLLADVHAGEEIVEPVSLWWKKNAWIRRAHQLLEWIEERCTRDRQKD